MTLRIVARGSNKQPLTTPEFMALFGIQHLERIEARARRIRETYRAPSTIADDAAFWAEAVRFYVHVYNTRWSTSATKEDFSFDMAWSDLSRWYPHGSPWYEVSRNAVTGNAGGFIRFVDDVTDGIVKQGIDEYIETQFFAYLPHRHDETWEQLVDELLSRYGHQAFFPNDPYLHPVVARAGMMSDLRQLLKAFILRSPGMQRLFRD